MYDRSMNVTKQLSQAGSLIGDPSRAVMLWSLLGGESRPASELAMLANVSPQTASNHLKLLHEAGFLKVEVIGRNKFYSLAGRSVANALESLAAAVHRRKAAGITEHTAPELVFARTCYDHLAGELGVAVLNRLQRANYLRQHSKEFKLTSAGEKFLRGLGVDTAHAQKERRRFAYACLDWSHRVPHLAGALGAAILEWMFEGKLLATRKGSRALRLTDAGERELRKSFAIELTRNRTHVAA